MSFFHRSHLIAALWKPQAMRAPLLRYSNVTAGISYDSEFPDQNFQSLLFEKLPGKVILA